MTIFLKISVKSGLLFTVLSLPLSVFAATPNPLLGQWIMQSQSCQASGALQAPPGLHQKIDTTLNIGDTQVNFDTHMKVSMDKAEADKVLKQAEAAKANVSRGPNTPDKQKQLEDIQASEDQINELVKGIDCTQTGKENYTIQGSSVTTTTATFRTNCPDMNASEIIGTTTKMEFKVNGNMLTMIDPISDGSRGCPPNDKMVSTFKHK